MITRQVLVALRDEFRRYAKASREQSSGEEADYAHISLAVSGVFDYAADRVESKVAAEYPNKVVGSANEPEMRIHPSTHSVPSSSPEWQPIATAPKDGTWMLGWNEDCGCFIWRDGPGLLTGEDPSPTHWMPLPDPPSAAVASSSAPE